MSATVGTLLDSFRSLTDEQKHELASEILRWSRQADHPPLQNDELAAAAEDIFLALDHDEQPHG